MYASVTAKRNRETKTITKWSYIILFERYTNSGKATNAK